MSWQNALATFRSGVGRGVWELPRDRVSDDLEAAASDPDSIDQGAFGFCGIAAFLRFWLRRDPEAAVAFATRIYDHGSASFGAYHVKPNPHLRGRDYMAAYATGRPRCPPGLWMVMGTIQDSISLGGFDGSVDRSWLAFLSLHEGAQPNQIATLLRDTGLYAKVDDRIDWEAIILPREPFIPDLWRPSRGDAEALNPGDDCDIILQINDRFLSGASPMPAGLVGDLEGDYPNHFVALASPISFAAGTATMRVWTWGNYQDVQVPQHEFLINYYGAIVSSAARRTLATPSTGK